MIGKRALLTPAPIGGKYQLRGVILLLCLALVSCSSHIKAVGEVDGANEDEFFILLADILSKDEIHDFERISEDGLSPEMRMQIEKAVLSTEGAYKIGQVYEVDFDVSGEAYRLFLMDTVSVMDQELPAPGGKKIDTTLGKRACGWALFHVIGRRTLDTGAETGI
jgi:hypothetical protein